MLFVEFAARISREDNQHYNLTKTSAPITDQANHTPKKQQHISVPLSGNFKAPNKALVLRNPHIDED